MTPTEQHTEPAAPKPLWRAMRAFLCLLFDLFGDPSAIAARGMLGARERALIGPWLRAGEAFLRRLLFIEALALNVDAKSAKPRPRAPRQRRPFYFYPDEPDDWRVSFRLLPSTRRVGRRGRRSYRAAACRDLELPRPLCAAEKPQESRFWLARKLVRGGGACVEAAPGVRRIARDPENAWPYAERLEAMLRAFNDPQRPAHRLARLMARDEARAIRALTPAPATLVERFGAERFKRCDAIVASRRRRRDRAQAQQWRTDSS